MRLRFLVTACVALATAITFPLAGSRAEEIGVGDYGVALQGVPWAVALAKGYFQEAGVDITAMLSAAGGGSDVRILIGGKLPMADASVASAVAAIQRGADIKIIAQTSDSVAELKFVVMPDSSVTDLRDFKGKRIGYTNPQSSTQMLELLLLERAGLSRSDVTMIATGGFGPGVTALEHGGLDIAPISEPAYTLSNGRYKMVLRGADAFPPIGNGVAITSSKTARERPEMLRGILAARRKAVAFVYSNPAETAEIAAKPYGLDAKTLESLIREMIAEGDARHFHYFPDGHFDWDGLNLMAHALNLVGIVKGPIDWTKMVDESFLPDDLKTKK